MSRYGKRRDPVVHEQEPFNAETGLAALAEGPLTATDALYVRGHGAVPEIDPAAWQLHVYGLVERELDLSLTTLREAFQVREVTATLQCAGGRPRRARTIQGAATRPRAGARRRSPRHAQNRSTTQRAACAER